MYITLFDAQTQQAQLIRPEQIKTSQGMIWLDVLATDTDWQNFVEQEFGLILEEQHAQDAANPNHPPFHDDTERYEMLIFRALNCANTQLSSFEVDSAPIVFFVYGKLLLSIHNTNKTNFDEIRSRWLRGSRVRAPLSPDGVLCLLLSWLTDQYLSLRISFVEQLEDWQTQMLKSTARFQNWASLLKAGSLLRQYRLGLIEPQQTALDEWRDERMEMDARILTRLTDVQEHFNRVDRDAEICQNDLENLVQIYFSASNQRMNDIMRVLTIASVIFLPLNLLSGIYGMNFEHMPGLTTHYGFILVILAMFGIVLFILGIFRWKKWL
ncbi:magnesium Mg(2+) and cobalt Co(2+) transport protein (corA) [Thiothrix eikelboomii]|uniref:Magnesium Mg(2+) and cobalt Co(2+) transport protein (CorA) n=1 Tax=Thiothrix eikelboomii TaxID=92487 RepID=A0A1T4XQI1_9GAMM|nr:magnesium transporter CorA family protein [Thiothrix eikelboomii]SKA91802.1 magnesium Mg(2+) and cobalt Co(2+) transport protein (corA) [Thiothrix eikelboomii]